MKYIFQNCFIAFLIAALFTIAANAQILQFVRADSVNYGTIYDYEIKAAVELKNISLSDLNIRLKVELIEKPAEHGLSFCIPGVCYSDVKFPITTDSYFNLSRNESSKNNIHFTLYPNGTAGTSKFKVSFFKDGTNEGISYILIFIIGLTNIENDIISSDIDLQVYPNPAKDILNLCLSNDNSKSKMEIAITDLNGTLISSSKIQNNLTCDLSKFNPGLYFITLICDGKKMSSQKIIIKH